MEVETFFATAETTNKACRRPNKKPRGNWENLVCGHPATHQIFIGKPDLVATPQSTLAAVCVCVGVMVCMCVACIYFIYKYIIQV